MRHYQLKTTYPATGNFVKTPWKCSVSRTNEDWKTIPYCPWLRFAGSKKLTFYGFENLSTKHESWKDVKNPESSTCKKSFSVISFFIEVKPTNTNFKFHLWPMWLMITNLPIVFRQSFSNLILLAVYARADKPSRTELKTIIFSPPNRPRTVIIKRKGVLVIFKLLYLLTDKVTEAGILNHIQLNRKFSCMSWSNEVTSEKNCRGWFIFLTKIWHCGNTLANWMMYGHRFKQTTPTS